MIHYGTYIFGGRSSAVDGIIADSAGGASWGGGRRGSRIGASLVNELGKLVCLSRNYHVPQILIFMFTSVLAIYMAMVCTVGMK